MNIPSKLLAGAKWYWTESLSEYPSSIYDLSITFKLGTADPITLNGTASGDDFILEKPANETASLSAGDYKYQGIATHKTTGEVIFIEEGIVPVDALLSAAGSTDTRSYWNQVLDLLKAAYKTLAEKGEAEVEINGRRVLYTDRTKLLMEIHNAEIKAGAVDNKPKKIFAKFIDN